jgi:hypothetical protein
MLFLDMYSFLLLYLAKESLWLLITFQGVCPISAQGTLCSWPSISSLALACDATWKVASGARAHHQGTICYCVDIARLARCAVDTASVEACIARAIHYVASTSCRAGSVGCGVGMARLTCGAVCLPLIRKKAVVTNCARCPRPIIPCPADAVDGVFAASGRTRSHSQRV